MAYKPKPKLPHLKCDWVICDISNILYRSFHAARPGDDDITIAGMATHSAFMSLNKYYKHFKPTKGVVMAFDRSSWRKDYTKSDQAHPATRPYKGNRRKNMTEAQAAKFQQFIKHLNEFESLITDHTTIITLAGEKLEADDMIAGFCQVNEGDHNIIISADSDLLQLCRYENTRVISPATDALQSLDDYNQDPLYYLFQKCVRGDANTDNIQSAFPRVRQTRIEKAYNDPYERLQLFKETWTDEKNNLVLVEDMFYENQKLIDLEKQPNDIRKRMFQIVDDSMNKDRKFSLFQIMKFCKRYDLQRIIEGIDNFIPMMSK